MRYDPNRPLDPQAWSELDEDEQLDLVAEYHLDDDMPVETAALHALVHTVVENQVLLGDETPAAATLARLMQEGLDRHDAIHAIGSVLSAYMFGAATGDDDDDPNAAYFREVEALTAEAWRSLVE